MMSRLVKQMLKHSLVMLASKADYHHALNGTRMGVRWYTMRRGMAKPRKVNNDGLPKDLQEQISRTNARVLFCVGSNTAAATSAPDVVLDGVESSLPSQPTTIAVFTMVAGESFMADIDGLTLDFTQWPPVVRRVNHIFTGRFRSTWQGKTVKPGDVLIGFGLGVNRFSIELPPPPSWPHYGRYGEQEESRGRAEGFGAFTVTPAMAEDYVLYCVQKTGRPLALHFIDMSSIAEQM